MPELLGDGAAVGVQVGEHHRRLAPGELPRQVGRDRRTPGGAGRPPHGHEAPGLGRGHVVDLEVVDRHVVAHAGVGDVLDGGDHPGQRRQLPPADQGRDAQASGVLAGVEVLGERRGHGDRAHGMAAQVGDARRVEARGVEGDDGDVGLAARDGREQVVDVDAALEDHHARVGLEVGQRRRLPRLARREQQHADHVVTPCRRPGPGRRRRRPGPRRAAPRRPRGRRGPAAGWSPTRRRRTPPARRGPRRRRGRARRPHRRDAARRSGRPTTHTSTRDPRTRSVGTCSGATAIDSDTVSSAACSPSAAAGTSSPADSGRVRVSAAGSSSSTPR